MLTALSKIWTCVVESIFIEVNHYTSHTSISLVNVNSIAKVICHKSFTSRNPFITVLCWKYIDRKQNCNTLNIYSNLFWSRYTGNIVMMVRVFTNGLGDLCSIPGWVIPKTQKMVLDASLLNTQHYKVQIKSKVEQSKERSSALS